MSGMSKHEEVASVFGPSVCIYLAFSSLILVYIAVFYHSGYLKPINYRVTYKQIIWKNTDQETLKQASKEMCVLWKHTEKR